MADQTQVVDAETDPDEAARALGLGGADVEAEDEDQREGDAQEDDDDEDQESALEDLPQFWQDEIGKLRRENAAARVKLKDARKATTAKVETSAVEAAKEEARREVRQEYGVRLAGSEVRAALADIVPAAQMDDLVDDLNLSRYVDDEGDVDQDAVKALRSKYQALLGPARKTTPKVNTAASSKTTAKSAKEEFKDFLTAY